MGAPIERFHKEVAKGKYGESELTQSDIKTFMKRASKEDIIEVEEEFFFPFTSKLAIEEDWDVSELDIFVKSVISD